MASIERNPLRLVLLGKTGVGKIAAGNTILGKKLFVSAVRATSVTKKCTAQTAVINQVTDTPGIPHAFLLLLDVRLHTEEERNTVKIFKEIFGDDVGKHMIVLFTHGDDLEFDDKSIEAYITEAGSDLKDLITSCGHRYHIFSNRSTDHTQVLKFLHILNKMLKENNHGYYNYELFTSLEALKKAEGTEKEKEKRLRELENQVRDLQSKGKLCIII